MRIVLIGIVIVLLTLSCILTIRYNQDATYAKEELNGERYRRMVAEESLKSAKEEVNSLKTEFSRVQSKLEGAEVLANNTKAINTELKQRLDEAAKIKLSLDRRIAELEQYVSPL